MTSDPERQAGLRLVVDNGPQTRTGPRVLAPGAPASPGPLPNDLAQYLEHGEVLAWWGDKPRIAFDLIGLTAGAAAVVLLGVTAFAPSFWSQPLAGFGPPVLALLSPTLLVLFREWVGRGSVLVTDRALVVLDRDGVAQRIPFAAIVAIRRDVVRGGVTIDTGRSRVRIPPALTEPTRVAVQSRVANRIGGAAQVDDPLGWLG